MQSVGNGCCSFCLLALIYFLCFVTLVDKKKDIDECLLGKCQSVHNVCHFVAVQLFLPNEFKMFWWISIAFQLLAYNRFTIVYRVVCLVGRSVGRSDGLVPLPKWLWLECMFNKMSTINWNEKKSSLALWMLASANSLKYYKCKHNRWIGLLKENNETP